MGKVVPTEMFVDQVCDFLKLDNATFRQYLKEYRGNGLVRWGGGTVEVTTAELLYILTRFKKPEVIIEAGTNWGWSAANLVSGAKDSGADYKFYTIDIEAAHLNTASNYLVQAALIDHIEFLHGDSVHWIKKILEKEKKVDIVFIDSSHEYEHTKKEFAALEPYVKDDTWLLFHDAVTDQYGVKQFLDELGPEWRKIALPTEDCNGFGVVIRNA